MSDRKVDAGAVETGGREAAKVRYLAAAEEDREEAASAAAAMLALDDEPEPASAENVAAVMSAGRELPGVAAGRPEVASRPPDR